jgi:hypothetical protein
MPCPRCSSLIVTKDGTTQLFRCTRCGRRFTRRSSSVFSGRGFPDDIIGLAPTELRRGQRVVGRARRAGRSEHDLSLGATLPSVVWRGGPQAPRPCWSRLAGRRDVRPNSRALALHLSRHRRARPDRGRLCVAYTRPDGGAKILRARNRLQRHDATPGHHRQGGHVSAGAGRGGAWRPASDRSVSDERHRARPRVSQRAAAADAGPQVCCCSGDLHAWSRPDAQHSTGFYRIVQSVPQRLILAWIWSRLAEAI